MQAKFRIKIMKAIIFLICIGALIGVLNCTNQNNPDNISNVESSRTLTSLETRVIESTEHLNSENWVKLHKYQNPKLRKPRFPFGLEIAQPCSKETFIYNMVSITEKIKSENNLSNQNTLRFELETVYINTATNVGKATIKTYYNGNSNLILQFEQRWTYQNNQWWRQEETMQSTCEKLGTELN